MSHSEKLEAYARDAVATDRERAKGVVRTMGEKLARPDAEDTPAIIADRQVARSALIKALAE